MTNTIAAHNAIITRPEVECSTLACKNNRHGNSKSVDRPKANDQTGLIHSS